MRRPARALALAFGVLASAGGIAAAAEITDVASSFDDDNPFDFRFRLSYQHDEKRAAIKREGQGPGQDDIVLYKDLLYARTRDSLGLRAEVGLFKDLAIHIELPVIFKDQADYRYDQSLGSGCVYPGQAGTVSCVNADNSTTVRDGLVPRNGWDAGAAKPGAPAGLPDGSAVAFRGLARGGSGLTAFDTLNLGLTWAPLSQRRDDTKPTWVVAFESQISFGQVAKYDRNEPADAQRGVSEGLHRLLFRTAISKRFRYVDPFMGFWYMLPLARGDSLYIDYGPSQKNRDPQQMAGTVFGLEGIPWERADKQYKVAISLRGHIEGRFTGRGYSEAWELLASSPALACDATWNPACNLNNKYKGQPFTGLTTIENHAILGIDFGIYAQLSKWARVSVGLDYTHDQGHVITADDVGRSYKDAGCTEPGSGRVEKPCEYNPAHRQIVNQVGRRYRVDAVDLFRFNLAAQMMF